MFVLLRQRNFGCIWIGGLISLTGDWMLLTALPVYIYQLTGSTLATGAMLAVRVGPRLVHERELLRANSLTALSNDVSRLVGPALGGIVVAATGLAGVAMLDAASFTFAATMAALTRVGRRW